MQPATKNDARLDYACLSVVGEVVRVHTTDGCVVEGIFVSRDTQATGLRVVLSGARYAVSSVHTTADPAEILSTLRIDSEHVVMIEAIDSPMRLEAAAAGSVHVRRTDGPREMQRWSAIEDDDGAGLEDVGQAEQAWDTGKWDQFQANERLGVKSTYDEHHYTTKLDKTKFSKEQKAKADQLAKDITQGGAPVRGIQHAMERDEVDLSKHDEGELHTDVGRDKAKPISTGAAGAYVPPSRRSAHSAPPAEGPDSPGPQGAQTGSLRPTAVPFRPPGAVEEEAPQPPMPPQQQPPQQPPQHMTPEPVLEPVVLKPTPQPLRFPATDDYFNQFAHTLHEAMMMTGDEPGFSADWPGDDCYRGDTAAYQGAAQGMYPPQNAYMPQSAQQGMQGGAPQGGYRGQPQGNYGMEGGMSSGYQDGMMGQGSMGQGGYNQGGYSQGGYNQQQGGYNQGYNQGGQQGMHGQQGGYNQGYNGHGQGGGYGPSSGAQGGYNQAPQQPPQQPPQQQGGYNQGGYDQGYNQPRMGGNGGGQGGYNQGYNQGAPPPQSGGPQGGYNQQQNSYQQQQPPMPRGGSGMQNRGRGGYGQNYQSPAPAPQQGYPQGGGQGGQGGYGQQQGAYPGHQQSPPSNVPPPGPGQFMQQPEMPPQQAPPSGGMGRGRGGMGRGRGAGGPPREANNSPLPPQAGPRARGGRR